MALGNRQAQEKPAATQRGDGFAGHHHRTLGHRHRQNLAVVGRQHVAFRALLHHDLPLRFRGGDLVAEHVDLGTQLIQPLAGGDAFLDQRLTADEFAFGVLQLRGKRLQLGVEGRHLKVDLVVAHDGDALPALHRVAFGNVERHQGAADAGARGERVARLDAAVDRLPFRNGDRLDDQSSRLRQRGKAERSEPGEEEAHHELPIRRLCRT